MPYIIIEDDNKSGHHVIINTMGRYENHGHLKKLQTAKLVINLIENKIVPKSGYLRGTVLRISLDEKFNEDVRKKISKDKNKPHYYNVNKGVRK